MQTDETNRHHPPVIEMHPDPLQPACITFHLKGENHTLGNILKRELNALECDFVGTSMVHPPNMNTLKLRVHKKGEDPQRMMVLACQRARAQLAQLYAEVVLEGGSGGLH